MSSYIGVKRRFRYGQHSDSWCTKCNGLRCEEDVGFLIDDRGNVQGYIIDSEKLREATSNKYPGENKRMKDSPPSDGIYKRPFDVKKYLSGNPFSVKKIRFSNDVLKLLLVGVEGCDGFVKGVRNVPCMRNVPCEKCSLHEKCSL
jgi:hypothetical protein